MCYDMESAKQTMGTSVATVNTRDMIFTPDHHNTYPVIDFPEEFRIDTKPFVNRPFFVESINWGNQNAYTLLNANVKMLPRDVFTSNPSLEMALKLGAYFRSDLSLNVSIAGTISHAGTLLVGILPPTSIPLVGNAQNKYLINTIMSGPHCFLHANEATSAVLHVPWYCNSDVASLDIRATLPATTTAVCESNLPGNFATLVVMVLNPLSPSTGSSVSLDLVVEACFSALDIFVPSPKFLSYTSQGLQHMCLSQGLQSIASVAIDSTTSYVKQVVGDAIDATREGIRYYTGLHNPNIPMISNRIILTHRNFPNNITGEQFFEKLDPYPEIDRIVDRPIFNTSVDEMSIKHILSKPQYLGTFRINQNDSIGKLVWCKPISPRQGGLDSNSMCIANNIELIHYLSRAWRGSINIHFQSVMNNKQQVKIRLVQLYNPPTNVVLAYPTYGSLLSAPTHLMEFTGGGQIQSVNLPYLCRNQLTPCAPDLNIDALFHGMYYVYVAQPLVISSDSPSDVNFNVFISVGDDCSFHGYSTEVARQTPLISPLGFSGISKNTTAILEKLSVDTMTTQGITVMNEPQPGLELTSYSTGIDLNVPHQERLFSPIDIRPLIRRMYQTRTVQLIEGHNEIDLNWFLSERADLSESSTPLQMVASMYYGKSAGLKFKIKSYNPAEISVAYVPVQFNVDNSGSVVRASVAGPQAKFAPSRLSGDGGYPLPFVEMAQETAGNTKLYEFVVPNTSFYKFIGGPEKFSPQLPVLSSSGAGHLLIWSTAATTITIYAGCTDESRFGFHCVAPIYRPIVEVADPSKNSTVFLGTSGGGPLEVPRVSLNPFVYFSRS